MFCSQLDDSEDGIFWFSKVKSDIMIKPCILCSPRHSTEVMLILMFSKLLSFMGCVWHFK